VYLDLRDHFRPGGEREEINDDIVFELELVHQLEVNIDYILMLVEKYKADGARDRALLEGIYRAVNASVHLRSKRELIESFIDHVNVSTRFEEAWQAFVAESAERDLAALIAEEKLEESRTREFIRRALRDGFVKTTGTDLDALLPPIRRFGSSDRQKRKRTVISKLMQFFDKYFGVHSFQNVQTADDR